MTIADLRELLDDLETRPDFGPHTQVFIDDAIRGLQEPVFYTQERFENGANLVIIETPKDTADEVT